MDLRAPVALRGDHARLLLGRAELAGGHPAHPVEAREVLDLPVARRPRLDAQHLAAGARPAQRAVVVVPRELQAAVGGQRVGQRLRVEQGPADVQPRRRDDGGEPGDHDDRQRRDRAVALDALEAEERAQQDRERDPLQPGVPTLDLHGRDGEQDAERDRGGQRAAQAARAALREREPRGEDPEQPADEQQHGDRPGVRAPVRHVRRRQVADGAAQARGQLVPVPGEQQPRCDTCCEQRPRDGDDEHRVAPPAADGEQRDGRGDRDARRREHLGEASRLERAGPHARAEDDERCEADEPRPRRRHERRGVSRPRAWAGKPSTRGRGHGEPAPTVGLRLARDRSSAYPWHPATENDARRPASPRGTTSMRAPAAVPMPAGGVDRMRALT